MLFQLLFIKKKRKNTKNNISIFPWNYTCNISLFKDPASMYIKGLGTKKGYKLQNHFYEGKETPKQNVSKMAFLEVLNQRTINNFLLCILVFFEFGKATAIIPYSQKTFFYLQEFFHIRHLLQLEPFPPYRISKFVAFTPTERLKGRQPNALFLMQNQKSRIQTYYRGIFSLD